MYDNFFRIISKNKTFLMVLITSFAVSAVVGAVFGYYGASLMGGSGGLTYTIKRDESSLPRGVDESTAVVNIVKKYSSAVVSIVATKDLPVLENTSPFQGFCGDPFFSQFFDCRSQPEVRRKSTERKQVGAGTGFVVKSDGLIVTNKHVVLDADASYTVITSDGKKYPAEVLARDPFQDLALIKIKAQNLPTVVLGNSDGLEIGQTVVAIGNALGQFSNSVSKGIVSGLSRSITAGSGTLSERLEKVIQTDAAINPGNSGGPLLNLRGEVIGINSAIVSGAQNVGFSIPINRAKKAIRDIELHGRIIYPYLGVRYAIINEEVKAKNNLPVDYGALVVKGDSGEPAVLEGSPAAKAGLKEGDIILEVDGKKLTDDYTLAEAVQSKNVGVKISLKVMRDGGELEIGVVLEEKSS